MKTVIDDNGTKIEIEVDSEEIEENEDKCTFTFNKKTNNKISTKIRKILPIVSLMAFFLCGFLIDNGWTWSWTLLLISPFIESFLKLKNKSIKKAIASLLDMVIIALVIFLGCYFHIWSWCWVFFFLIPIAHIILE